MFDLRGTKERSPLPSPLAGDPGYRWTPFVDEQADRRRDHAADVDTQTFYLCSVKRNGGHIAAD